MFPQKKEMAIAGCYGGPIFNILVGLGLSFLFVSIEAYPSSYHIELDISSIVSILFLYLALLLTTTIVSLRNFKLEKPVGIVLICLYAVYSLSQLWLVLN